MFRIVTCVFLVLGLLTGPLMAKEISVGLLLNPKQRDAFSQVFKKFTEKFGIQIQTIAKSDADYKEILPVWLLEGKDTPDVLYWQASQRLFDYTQKGVIHPITGLWQEENLDENFSHVKTGVTYEGEVYALPYSYYHWGLFYKKGLIDRYGGEPNDWNGFVAMCKQIQSDGVTPIGIGLKYNWPAAAWFDYLNLRINGLAFHQRVLTGEVPFKDERIMAVFKEWKKLIDAGCFNEDSAQMKWDDVLPVFYRDRAAFTLIGNFASNKFPAKMIEDIGFMPFPKLKDIPLYEEAPMDVFMIPKSAKNMAEAEALIRFLAKADVQSELNEMLGFLPCNKKSKVGDEKFIQAGYQLLQKAQGVSQYFDRDTVPAFEKIAVPALADFMHTGDISRVVETLEKGRQEVFQ